jgi:hypothetical protein
VISQVENRRSVFWPVIVQAPAHEVLPPSCAGLGEVREPGRAEGWSQFLFGAVGVDPEIRGGFVGHACHGHLL